MKKKIFIAAAVIFSSTAQAQDSTKILNEVLLTATKFPVKQSQTGKVVTVISREQIEKNSGKTVGQLLNEQAGITINGAYNAAGSVQTVFTRGASSGRTLVLLDGIPVSDPSMINNEFDLNLFSINDVERIEICKGAQSTLYGSDAIKRRSIFLGCRQENWAWVISPHRVQQGRRIRWTQQYQRLTQTFTCTAD